MTEWTDEERGFVETALAAADAGNAGHWPTVAAYLAAEVRRLRALDGATPAVDRDVLTAALGWVDNALRNGSAMTRANLAFEVLCRQLGVDRDSLNTSDAAMDSLRSELTGGAS